MPLTDTQIRAVQSHEKAFKLFDTAGLFLLVKPNGSRCWNMKYRFAGKEKKLSFGLYPEVSLKEARQRCEQARKDLRDGLDPAIKKKIAKIVASENSFKAVAEEWLDLLKNPLRNPKGKQQKAPLAEGTLQHKRTWLDDHILPYIGARQINAIAAPEILELLRRVERQGIIETAHRVRSTCSRVFRYGIATGRCERDPAADVIGALTPVVVTHHAALTEPRAVGALLRALDGYRGEPVTRIALQLLPLVFLRSTELRFSTWSQIDFEAAEWRIPARRMKMREMHIVPLSTQAAALLGELHPLTGSGDLIFQGTRPHRPISENTVNGALRRLGYTGDEMTGHGFRTVASTFLNEQGWNRDLIELQLAHSERDETRAAYNQAQRLDDRRKMMQAWADYLDRLRAGNVVSIFAKSA